MLKMNPQSLCHHSNSVAIYVDHYLVGYQHISMSLCVMHKSVCMHVFPYSQNSKLLLGHSISCGQEDMMSLVKARMKRFSDSDESENSVCVRACVRACARVHINTLVYVHMHECGNLSIGTNVLQLLPMYIFRFIVPGISYDKCNFKICKCEYNVVNSNIKMS